MPAIVYYVLSIAIAYVIGSISSAYVIGKLTGAIDMRAEPDGRVSAAAVYRRLGIVAFALVVAMDISLAVSAVAIARILTDSPGAVMLAGIAAVIGHNWSPFLRFKGGLGATTICGVMGSIALIPFMYGLGIAGVLTIVTMKPGLSSGIGIASMSGVYFMMNGFAVVGLLPLALLALMLIKRIMLRRTARAGVGAAQIGLDNVDDDLE